MHTYFVAYERSVPTGRFFAAWMRETDSLILHVQHPITTDKERLLLKASIADIICTDTDPRMGRGVSMQHWVGQLFVTQSEVEKTISITNIQHLHSRPSGAPAP